MYLYCALFLSTAQTYSLLGFVFVAFFFCFPFVCLGGGLCCGGGGGGRGERDGSLGAAVVTHVVR
eukprot:COSAG01_NODE_24649_length_773_cov_0.552749_1_plen_64_part_10